MRRCGRPLKVPGRWPGLFPSVSFGTFSCMDSSLHGLAGNRISDGIGAAIGLSCDADLDHTSRDQKSFLNGVVHRDPKDTGRSMGSMPACHSSGRTWTIMEMDAFCCKAWETFKRKMPAAAQRAADRWRKAARSGGWCPGHRDRSFSRKSPSFPDFHFHSRNFP